MEVVTIQLSPAPAFIIQHVAKIDLTPSATISEPKDQISFFVSSSPVLLFLRVHVIVLVSNPSLAEHNSAVSDYPSNPTHQLPNFTCAKSPV